MTLYSIRSPYYPHACVFIDAYQILLEELKVSENKTGEITIKVPQVLDIIDCYNIFSGSP